MKTKDIFRAFRYYKMEQTPNPKTGQRQPMPSIKFLVLFVALGIVGLLIFLNIQDSSPSDGGALTDSSDPSDTNSTSPSPTPTGSGQDEPGARGPAPVLVEPSARKH